MFNLLRTTKISFPGLGIGEFEVNSNAFSIGNLSIAWYALIITFGMILCVAYIMYRAKGIGINSDVILDFALFVIPIGIIGARLYYVLSEIDRYSSFSEVINLRSGGLAIYGGIITGTITVFVICRIKKIYFPAFGDCVVPGLILAQSIGRWGNFMNGEAYGEQTDIFIRMGLDFGVGMKYYHPTFLYESLWNLVGFILINIFYKHKKYDGQIILMVFGWYGLGRMFIEGLRTDSLWFSLFGADFRTSQVLAAVVFVVCTFLLIYFAFKKPNREFYFRTPVKKTKKG